MGARAFDVLLVLVLQAGAVISVKDLMRFVWPNITVEEANLRVQMAVVRKTLAQCEDAQCAIETIPLRGYCFILPVHHCQGRAECESLETLEVRPRLPHVYLHGFVVGRRFPTTLCPIVGREDAIQAIVEALSEHRLVTIVGPGGIGKTTVAIATATRYGASFGGSNVFVDLSQATDGAAAARAIAQALDVETEGDVIKAIGEHLGDRDVLLILDTCEHIVESIASLAEFLLGDCPGLRLMVTSREALRTIGEWTHRLSSLTFPEEADEIDEENMQTFSAVVLFVERIRSAMRFEVHRRDLAVLAEICRRLDGIPLALEFAAARVPDLGIRALAAHLDDRFAILTRGRRTALPRHRSLSAVIDWSYNLLSEEEQRMLGHLAMLNGSFTADYAVTSGEEAGCVRPADALSGLFEKSLLAVDMRNDAPVYRLLDTTRAYIMDRSAVLAIDLGKKAPAARAPIERTTALLPQGYPKLIHTNR